MQEKKHMRTGGEIYKNNLPILGTTLLAAALLSTGALAADTGWTFDFEQNDGGFTPIFADYPVGDDVDEFYELNYEWTACPQQDNKALFLSGNNHSDDLFMGVYQEISGLTAGQLYEFQASFRLATNVESGMIGVGGSPGASVYVKGGITAEKPRREPDAQQHYRLNIDKGNQGTDGCDMRLLGDLEKKDAQRPGAYEWKTFSFTMRAKANDSGCVYLIIGTDSGFEATSSYYLDDISVSWTERQEMPITRGAAIQMMYDAGLPAPGKAPTFSDVAADSPYCAAIGWAQEAGIVSGYGANRFGADDDLTVAQALTILYRYVGRPNAGESIADLGSVPAWARDAAAWALQNHLIAEDDLKHDAAMSEYAFTRAWNSIPKEQLKHAF